MDINNKYKITNLKEEYDNLISENKKLILLHDNLIEMIEKEKIRILKRELLLNNIQKTLTIVLERTQKNPSGKIPERSQSIL